MEYKSVYANDYIQGNSTAVDESTANIAATVPVVLRINGYNHQLDIDPRTTLLDCIRETVGLTGTKKGCDHGQCGACTVHVNGRRVLWP
jgi:xanthine dehydrogenase YagT iron-sulfur-binding subunit